MHYRLKCNLIYGGLWQYKCRYIIMLHIYTHYVKWISIIFMCSEEIDIKLKWKKNNMKGNSIWVLTPLWHMFLKHSYRTFLKQFSINWIFASGFLMIFLFLKRKAIFYWMIFISFVSKFYSFFQIKQNGKLIIWEK